VAQLHDIYDDDDDDDDDDVNGIGFIMRVLSVVVVFFVDAKIKAGRSF
jgi:hypothetical protein